MILEYFFVIMAYFVGSIPFGLLLGRCAGIDVRKAGSGNIGATNVTRLAGKKLGVLTLLSDVLKAVLPMLAASIFLDAADQRLWVASCGGAAFIGHLYPIYLGFQGGKGVATALGIFLYLAPWAALLDIGIFAAVLFNWGYVSLGSLTAALMMPGLVWLIYGAKYETALAVVVCSFIWLKHRENIQRLVKGEEGGWRKKTE